MDCKCLFATMTETSHLHSKLKSDRLIRVNLDVTSRCNYRCGFCNLSNNREHFMSVEHFCRIFDALANASVSSVTLFGGEPALHPKLVDIAKEARYRGLVVRLLTNGSTMTPTLAHSLSKQIESASVSLHGFRETHQTLTGAKGSFEKAISAIDSMTSAGMTLDVCFTLVRQNLREVAELAHLMFSTYGAHRFIVNRFVPQGVSGVRSRNMYEPSAKELNQVLEDLAGLQESKRIRLSGAVPLCLIRPELRVLCSPCTAGFEFGAIDQFGNLKLCSSSNKVLGNILENELVNVWQSTELEEYRSLDWLDKKCTTCDSVQQCMGGCRATDPSKLYTMDVMYRDPTRS